MAESRSSASRVAGDAWPRGSSPWIARSGRRTETRSGSARPEAAERLSRFMPSRFRDARAWWQRQREASTVLDVSTDGRPWRPAAPCGPRRALGPAEPARRRSCRRPTCPFVTDLADDGKADARNGRRRGRRAQLLLLRPKTDGSAPVWLGEGDGQALSPDGRFALAVLVHTRRSSSIVAPTGAGETRTLEPGAIVGIRGRSGTTRAGASFSRESTSRIVERFYVQDVAGGPPRAVTEEGVTLARIGRPVSPDGRQVVAVGPDGVPALYPLAGGQPVALPGLGELDVPICWTTDGRELLVASLRRRCRPGSSESRSLRAAPDPGAGWAGHCPAACSGRTASW